MAHGVPCLFTTYICVKPSILLSLLDYFQIWKMKKQMWCIYSEWLRWFFFALVWKRSCESLLSLEGTRVGRSGSRSVTPHTGILIRREPWGETVHLAESTLSIWSPGCYPESSQKTASILTTTQQADWKSLKANTSIFVLSVFSWGRFFFLALSPELWLPHFLSRSIFFSASVSTLTQH